MRKEIVNVTAQLAETAILIKKCNGCIFKNIGNTSIANLKKSKCKQTERTNIEGIKIIKE